MVNFDTSLTLELTHGESLFVAEALHFYIRDLWFRNDELGDDDNIAIARKLIPKFKIKVKEVE